MKMVHTIFDYIVGNPANDRQVGKNQSGWNVPDSRGGIGGGHTPRMSCLRRANDEIPHAAKVL